MSKYLFFILFVFACAGPQRIQESVEPLAAPDNKMIVINNGVSKFRDIEEVLDENNVVQFEDTLSMIATKSDLTGLGGGTQELSITDDSIAISGGNKIVRDIVTVDNLAAISGTFPNGTIVQTKGFSTVNDGAGAIYQVQPDSIAGYVTDGIAVIDLGSNYAVLQPQDGRYNVLHFGAKGDGLTDDSTPLQSAINFARGKYKVFAPAGTYVYATSLTWGNKGIMLEGTGSEISDAQQTIFAYTGAGDAFSVGTGFTSAVSKQSFKNFALQGTAAATHGFDFDYVTHGGLIQNDVMDNVYISGFIQAGSYAIYATRTYNMIYNKLYIETCDGGIFLGTETVRNQIKNSWIRNIAGHAIHSTYSGQSTVSGGVIDHVGTPAATQRAVYMAAGSVLNLDNIHMEGNYMHIEAIAGAKAIITRCRWNSQDVNSVFANGSRIKMIGNYLPDNVGVTAGLGTEWVGDLQGTHTFPTITADIPSGFATYNYLDGSAGSWILQDYTVAGLPDGEFTLEFLDDSVSIDHEPAGGGGRIITQGATGFKGHTGDRITFIKRENAGGIATIVETSRRRAKNRISVTGRTYQVNLGESGLTFDNDGALDTVEFLLPINSLVNGDNPQYTFLKEDAQVVLITATGSRTIQGGAANGNSIKLETTGTSVSLTVGEGTQWKAISNNGIYLHLNPAASTYYTGGVISGVGLDAIRDSLGIGTTYTADRVLYTDGTAALANSTYLQYNGTGATNTRRITMHNDNISRLQVGTGLEFPATSNRPHVAGIGDLTFSTAPALSLVGYRHAGTYAAKTDLTDLTAQLIGINAYGWRNNNARNSAGISLGGANTASTNGYSGVIGFSTSDGTTYARRMTLHRNGDLYIGTGLGATEPDATTSKLLIRGGGTGTGNTILAEDSGGTDVFSLKDNGELIVGATDNGSYLFQVNGNSYLGGITTVDGNFFALGAAQVSQDLKLSTVATPGSSTNSAFVWAGDVTAGQTELYARGETGNPEQITGLAVRVTSNFSVTSSTALVNVTGLSRNVEAGKVYEIKATLYTTSANTGGIKAAVAGTATATSIIYEGRTVNSAGAGQVKTRATALASAVGAITNVTVATLTITGTIVVNTAGTLTIQFAQNSSDGTASVVLAGSTMQLIPISN